MKDYTGSMSLTSKTIHHNYITLHEWPICGIISIGPTNQSNPTLVTDPCPDYTHLVHLFCTLLACHNVSFYISGCHGCRQMEREYGGSVRQLATPCEYPDVSCETTKMDQDGSVLMKALL